MKIFHIIKRISRRRWEMREENEDFSHHQEGEEEEI